MKRFRCKCRKIRKRKQEMKKIDEAVTGYEEEFDGEIMRQNNGAEFRFNENRSCRKQCRR